MSAKKRVRGKGWQECVSQRLTRKAITPGRQPSTWSRFHREGFPQQIGWKAGKGRLPGSGDRRKGLAAPAGTGLDMADMSPETRPQLLTLKAPPPGDYDTWSDEERFNAEHHCYTFAQEYMVDHDAAQASLRLGYRPAECAAVGTRYIQHWLTQHYLKEIRRNFRQQAHATHDTVMSLIYRDASNFNPKANPMARASAQKLLVSILDMNAPKKVEKSITNTNPARHIMVVPHAASAEDWEAKAMERQRKLKEDARK